MSQNIESISKTLKSYFLIPVVTMLCVTTLHAQVNLSEMEPSSIDSLQKSRIRYFSPGMGGKDRVWDFSEKLSSDESSQVLFMRDSTGMLSVFEFGGVSHYRSTPDTLILISSETPLENRKYVMEKPFRKFTLQYGDSIIEPYRCEGVYCGDHPFRVTGTTAVRVDAHGSIMLAEGDTLRDVFRTHTIDAYTVCMDIDTAALDTARLTQVIDERYDWYLPGSQYPVIEDVTSTTYSSMNAVGTTKYAYCNLPEDQAARYITPGDGEETDEQEGFPDGGTTIPDIIHYSIETLGNVIQISYDLDGEATITAVVANHMGFLYLSRQWTQEAGQGYVTQIDCGGLRPGIYILYINVNGKVYSEKVTL